MRSLNIKENLAKIIITTLISFVTVFAIAYNSLNPHISNYITFNGSRYMFVLEFVIISGLGFILGLRHKRLEQQATNKNYYLRVLTFFGTYALFTYTFFLGVVGSSLNLTRVLALFSFIWKINNPTFVIFWMLILSPLYSRWLTQTKRIIQWLLVILSFIFTVGGLLLVDYTNQLSKLYLVAILAVFFTFSLAALIKKLPSWCQKLQATIYLPLILGLIIFGSLNLDINFIWWNSALPQGTGLFSLSNYSLILLFHLVITLVIVAAFEFFRSKRKQHPQALILIILLPLSYYLLQASNYGFKFSTIATGTGSIWLSLMNISLLYAFYWILAAIFKQIYTTIGLYSLIIIVTAYANMQKVLLRNEPITPLDLKNITILPKLIGMLNASYLIVIIVGLAVFLLAILFVQRKFNQQIKIWWPWRIVIAALGIGYFTFWINFLPTQTVSWNTSGTHVANSSVMRLARYRTITMIIPLEHYRDNGTLLGFASMLKVTAMDKPTGYSATAVRKIAQKYQTVAKQINSERENNINDQTIIYILSESLANPERIPGVKLSQNPLPNITQYQAGNGGGLFFSNGYGGGTANIEFEALTSLSMNNFSPSMSIPYSFLVPKLNYFPTIINAFSKRSAVHPYTGQTYERNKAFKKFGFTNFYAESAGTAKIKYDNKLGNSPYVSDAASYANVLDLLNKTSQNQIIQLSTMQNHMPYSANYYATNTIESQSNLIASSQTSLTTYTEGINITDRATAQFINEIKKMKKKVTVVLYGDHLPGIYTWKTNNAQKQTQYDNILHQSDYFIYSNFEEQDVGKQVVSPNMLNPLLFAKTNAKVSPFYALMTDIALKTPAAELGKYLTDDGNYLAANNLTKKQKAILADYNLIMYDLTSGKKYLNNTSFYQIPTSK